MNEGTNLQDNPLRNAPVPSWTKPVKRTLKLTPSPETRVETADAKPRLCIGAAGSRAFQSLSERGTKYDNTSLRERSLTLNPWFRR